MRCEYEVLETWHIGLTLPKVISFSTRTWLGIVAKVSLGTSIVVLYKAVGYRIGFLKLSTEHFIWSKISSDTGLQPE